MTVHSSNLAWRIPWTEESGRLQSIGSQKIGQDWRDLACTQANRVKAKTWKERASEHRWPTEVLCNEIGFVSPAVYCSHNQLMQFYQWVFLANSSYPCSVIQQSYFLCACKHGATGSVSIGNGRSLPSLESRIRVGCLMPLYDWPMMAISVFSNAVEKPLFLNWCQLALISQTISYFKTTVKLSLICLVEAVYSKSMGKRFSLDAFVSSAIYSLLLQHHLTSILTSKRKWNIIYFWRHWSLDNAQFSLPF